MTPSSRQRLPEAVAAGQTDRSEHGVQRHQTDHPSAIHSSACSCMSRRTLPSPPSPVGGGGSADVPIQFRMFTARAMIITAITSDSADCTIIVIFAQRVTGSVSVGLNAVALVNDR